MTGSFLDFFSEVLSHFGDAFYGDRSGWVLDPFGHIWSVSTPVKMSDREKEAKRQAAFAMMGAGEPSGSEKSWT